MGQGEVAGAEKTPPGSFTDLDRCTEEVPLVSRPNPDGPRARAQSAQTISGVERTNSEWIQSSRYQQGKAVFFLRAYEDAVQSFTGLGRLCGFSHTSVKEAIAKARMEEQEE